MSVLIMRCLVMDYDNNNCCKTCNILALEDVILTLRNYNFFVLKLNILTSACVGY